MGTTICKQMKIKKLRAQLSQEQPCQHVETERMIVNIPVASFDILNEKNLFVKAVKPLSVEIASV